MITVPAVEILRQVALLPEFRKMNLSTVKGFLGELLVKERLEREGCTVEHFGNQSGYDLRFNHKGGVIQADVKMSLLKDEFGWGFDYWGWALQHENKKKAISATHFICIGCSKQLHLDAVFVVRATDLHLFPRGTRQFGKVKHGLVLPPCALPAGITEPNDPMYKASQGLLTSGAVKQVAAGELLSDACG